MGKNSLKLRILFDVWYIFQERNFVGVFLERTLMRSIVIQIRYSKPSCDRYQPSLSPKLNGGRRNLYYKIWIWKIDHLISKYYFYRCMRPSTKKQFLFQEAASKTWRSTISMIFISRNVSEGLALAAIRKYNLYIRGCLKFIFSESR